MHIPLEDQASRVRVKYGRERRYCKECGGKGICERGGCAEGYRGCEDCGGKGICEHGRVRREGARSAAPNLRGCGVAQLICGTAGNL